jgi:hypothetical protein
LELEEMMTAMKEKMAEAFNKATAHANREAETPTYRTILIAVSFGARIGLLLIR